jgi:cation transport ATPase
MRRSNQFINMNLFWSFSYNICILPIVAGAFYSLDVDISPVWSSIAMSISSLVVVSFSHLLVCYKYDSSLEHEPKKETLSPRRSSEKII